MQSTARSRLEPVATTVSILENADQVEPVLR